MSTPTVIAFFDSAGNELGRVERCTLVRDLARQSHRDNDQMRTFKAAHPETATAKILLPSGSVMTEYVIDAAGDFVNRAWMRAGSASEAITVTIRLTPAEAAHLMIAARSDREVGPAAKRALESAGNKLQGALNAIGEASPRPIFASREDMEEAQSDHFVDRHCGGVTP